jgi:hypothetical protein
MKKRIYIYRLTDALGNIDIAILNESDGDETIGGYDKDGQYHQYDSYELYYAYDWAKKHGFVLESATVDLEIPDEIFDSKDFERVFDVKMSSISTWGTAKF